MATLEDDDEMVLISADELDEMHRPMPSDDLSAEAESENEDEEDEVKGTALDDYQPSDPGELELQKGDIVVIHGQTLDKKWFDAANKRTGLQGMAPARLVNLDCDDSLEPVPQHSNLRRGQVIMRRGVNKDSARRSGTLIDADSLPAAFSSAGALEPTMVTKDRSATLAVPRQHQQFEDPREKRLVASEAFASRNVPQEFKRIEQFNIVSVASADKYSRPVIAFSSCRLPPSYQISHDRLLEYLKFRLDQYVESDYVVVYFHYGLSSTNKPSYSWLWQVHKELDRKYKKNIKKLYIVHPTSFIKMVSALLKPYISYKFGKKLVFVNRLDDLKPVLYLDQIDIPTEVRNYDASLRTPVRPIQEDSRSSFYFGLNDEVQHQPVSVASTLEFGVPLRELQERSGDDIPLVMRKSIAYIQEHGMSTVGIFRRTPSQNTLREIKMKFNYGADVDFDEYADPHLAAVTLKLFLRELPEPLLTFEAHDMICSIKSFPDDQRIHKCIEVVHSLPELNYSVLKYLFNFIGKVASNEAENKMSAANLSIVFGPNLVWSRNQVASLNSMSDINRFTLILVDRYAELFTK